MIYAPATNPRTGREIFPALQPGSELGWAGLAGPEPVREAVEFFQYVVSNDPKWDFRTLDFDADVARAEKAASRIIDAVDPNLQPFFARGGKVLMYHGWNDQLVAPMNSVNYYQAVVSATQGSADSIRLFMMPGVTHCRGGIGPDSFDRMAAIERWVEAGEAPIFARQQSTRRSYEILRHAGTVAHHGGRGSCRWRPHGRDLRPSRQGVGHNGQRRPNHQR
jgi:feruloyl esterase